MQRRAALKNLLIIAGGTVLLPSCVQQDKKASITGTVKDSLQAPMLYATINLYKAGQPQAAQCAARNAGCLGEGSARRVRPPGSGRRTAGRAREG